MVLTRHTPSPAAPFQPPVEVDFRRLIGRPDVRLAAPPRHGVTVVVAPAQALPDDALAALSRWRTRQYLAAGFLDPAADRPPERPGPGDLHALAVGDGGRLLAAASLKRLPGTGRMADPRRPRSGCEEAQGRDWQRTLPAVQAAPVARCREVSRFVRDLSRPPSPLLHRATLEVSLALGRAVTRTDSGVAVVIGDLDPAVAGRSLGYLFVPAATFPAGTRSLPAGHPLAPRYRRHPTAPFAFRVGDLGRATFLRWADIDAALACPDEEFVARRAALRRFVLVRPSSLQARLTPPSLSRWPGLVVAAGDRLPAGRVVVVADGEVRALPAGRPEGPPVACLGPGAAYVPQDEPPGGVGALVAVTPGRVLLPSAAAWSSWR